MELRRLTITTVNLTATIAHFKQRGMKMNQEVFERGNSLIETDVNGLIFITFLPETVEANNLPDKDLPFYNIIWDSEEGGPRPTFETNTYDDQGQIIGTHFQECGWI